jgi:hypothetical protein
MNLLHEGSQSLWKDQRFLQENKLKVVSRVLIH